MVAPLPDASAGAGLGDEEGAAAHVAHVGADGLAPRGEVEVGAFVVHDPAVDAGPDAAQAVPEAGRLESKKY